METRAWKDLKFAYPEHIPTMLSNEEILYLYWLGRSVWQGEGIVIEIGPWLGGSTACLALGMRSSRHDAHKRLKVFDNFTWRDFMAARVSLPIQPGDSFEPFFLGNIRDFHDIVETHARALPDEVIPDDREAQNKRFHETDKVPIFEKLYRDPVEILFIDGAKSWYGMLYLLKTLKESLVPGKSCLVCQDYKYWGTYWVPIMMARLERYVEPVHNVLTGTTVTFRLTSGIPVRLLETFETDVAQLDTERTLTDIDRAGQILAQDGDRLGAAHVQLAKVSFLSHQGNIEKAAEAFKKSQESWNLFHPVWQLERARAYLGSEKSIRISRRGSHAVAELLKKAWHKVTGKTGN